MPIYEYVCIDCSKIFESVRPMSQADSPLACQSCGGEHVKRKMAVFYAMSGGHTVAGKSCGCDSSCSGGHCSGCSH